MKRIIPHNYRHEIKQGKRLSKPQKIANGLFWREYHYQKDNPPVVLPLLPAQLNFGWVIGDWARVDALRARIAAKAIPTGKYLTQALRDAELARNWGPRETERLRTRLVAELERTGTLRLAPHHACNVGLSDTVYALLEQARFDHLFEPEGRLPEGEWALWGLFARGGDAMRRDIRFVKLCARLGLCSYWVQTDRWPDCAAELAPFYDFKAEARKQAAATLT